MWIIGYEFKSAYGRTIRKVVVCESFEEYKRIQKIIWSKDGEGYKCLSFDEVIRSTDIK